MCYIWPLVGSGEARLLRGIAYYHFEICGQNVPMRVYWCGNGSQLATRSAKCEYPLCEYV